MEETDTDLYILPKGSAGNQLEGIERPRGESEILRITNEHKEVRIAEIRKAPSPSVSGHLAGPRPPLHLLSPPNDSV